jgi:cellulose biosynthesis protein BcsQ
MATIISLFNHKGGVGKTTTAFHLAWMFTELGKRVLMVDADSQCNLTLITLGEEGFEQHDRAHPNENLETALSAAFESRPELLKAVDCPNAKDNDRLFLLPGSYGITKYELQLGVSICFDISFSTMMDLPGSFYRVMDATAEKYDADIVLIDMNPSLSSLNQTLLFSSNYFIIPCNPDYFSEQALKSLSEVIPSWSMRATKAKEYFKEATYPFPSFATKFLGYTVNENGRSAQTSRGDIQRIDTIVDEVLLNALAPRQMLISDRKGIPYQLATPSNPSYEMMAKNVLELIESDQQI